MPSTRNIPRSVSLFLLWGAACSFSSDPTSVPLLPNNLTGQIYQRGQPGYDALRIARWNDTLDRNSPGNVNTLWRNLFPAVIVLAADVADVRTAMRWAHANNMTVSVRSGGHGYDGCSSGDGVLLLDLGAINEITRLNDTLVRVGAGTRHGELHQALSPQEVAVTMGSCFGVGIGGLALGGGHGVLAREEGLTIDALMGAELVMANGTAVNVSAQSQPELFWAIKGGGGGMAVVVSYIFRVSVAKPRVFYKQRRGWDPQALIKWQSWAPSQPSASWHASHLLVDPDGQARMELVGVYSAELGTEAQVQQRVEEGLGTLESAGYGWPPVFWSWMQTGQFLNWEPDNRPHQWMARSMVVKPDAMLGEDSIAQLAKALAAVPDQMQPHVNLDAYGGAIANKARNETAFPHRDAAFVMQLYLDIGNGGNVSLAHQWLDTLFESLKNHSGGAYRSYANSDVHDLQRVKRAYFGENLPRLEKLKAEVDPTNTIQWICKHSLPSLT